MPSPGHIALVTGLVSTSYFAFGNIANAYVGVMAATARGQTNIPVVDRLALWNFAFHAGRRHLGGAGAVSTLALATSAYLTGPRPLRDVFGIGAIAAFSIAAFTLLILMPVNNDLIATLQAASVKPMEPKEEKRVLDQLDKWRSLHRVRIVLGLVPWLASATALLASDAMIKCADRL
ncbi:hypothetical protein C8F04DRAFT_1251464 [Mycena alexandri]|uniref:DUF1772-domain-containing protein n=1 Tax=Mycena alexandri TaxID=1745969 RepID=A0AAD6TBG9_9AGAR|nr:hypothetical protein C8F04DRAFT_1251464 [Mycena alexandri]